MYDYANGGGSTLATHVARRLIDGIFIPEAVLQCTFTGNAPRAHGKARQSEKVQCLNSAAKDAILSKLIFLTVNF